MSSRTLANGSEPGPIPGPPCGGTVLVAGDHSSTRQIMSAWLRSAGYHVLTAANGREAWAHVQREQPPIVVSDWNMPNMTGVELCRAIRQEQRRHQVYVLMATDREDRKAFAEALQAGVDDFLTKPIDQTELLARVRQAEHALARFQHQADLADSDPLTGIMNRRSLTEQCEREISRAGRYRIALSCMLVDLDLFKFINDTFGHGTGDRALCAVANTIRDQIRVCDYLGRYGGDEFCLLLPETTEDAARNVAERLRQAIARQIITVGERSVPLRATFGVAQLRGDVSAAQPLFDLADQALLMAKQSGRNRVVGYAELSDLAALDTAGTDENRGLIAAALARDVMSTPVVCLDQDEPLRSAADLFLRLRITSAPVTDASSKLVGIVSERDLLNATIAHAGWESPVRDVMRTDVACYEEDTPAIKIWEFLRRVTTRRIVVVRHRSPIGVISRGSLLRWLGNWGMLRCDTKGAASAQARDVLRRRSKTTVKSLSEEVRRLRGEVEVSHDNLVPTLINAATRLQDHAQHLLALCQIGYGFDPSAATTESPLDRAGPETDVAPDDVAPDDVAPDDVAPDDVADVADDGPRE